MRRATPDVIYSYTASTNPVTFTVHPGEVFQVETLSAWGRQFDSHAGQFVPDAPSAINASTGCIAAEVARAGQNLVVHVLGIDLDEFGFTSVGRRSILLPHLSGEEGWQESKKIVRISREQPGRSSAPAGPTEERAYLERSPSLRMWFFSRQRQLRLGNAVSKPRLPRPRERARPVDPALKIEAFQAIHP